MKETAPILVKDNAFLRQYELKNDQGTAKVEYSQQERKIFLTKLIIPSPLEDDVAFRDGLLHAIFEDIREVKKLKVIPSHPKIAGFVRKYKNQYKDMLPVGISI